ncbi:programmed cell death protein 2-like isoform X1 [Vigna radiata var. radiata]|uniref:Programmed cell death protein 2-like isoform X1 n=1 Tax=Vigna radiata var. radiata TaxID=3916 RepID=A0A1S3T807_VIGRR|nr:programmed cell death protein 2-like isoform X1 [Vigna radiata var. radiata]
MAGTLLGMPGPWAEDYREPSDPYTTKIGGLPDWPLPINADLLRCASCAGQLCLVAQVYAPLSQHRTLFVLGCVSPECGTVWRVLRVQNIADLDSSQRKQPASVGEVPCANVSDDEDVGDMDFEQLGKALFEAGTAASNAKRKKPRKKRQNKAPSSSPHPKPTALVQNDVPGDLVPCFYIYAQEESSSLDLSVICSSYSSLSLKEAGSDVEDPSQPEEAWEKEHYEYDKALTADRTYLKFKKRLDAYPEQCFRYSYGGRPILAAVDEINPGSCRLCGKPRQFEMQLMPPLLYFLQEALGERRHLVEKWDWMTLIVYTCSESCSLEIEQAKSNMGWIIAEEAVVAQCEESMPVQPGFFS